MKMLPWILLGLVVVGLLVFLLLKTQEPKKKADPLSSLLGSVGELLPSVLSFL